MRAQALLLAALAALAACAATRAPAVRHVTVRPADVATSPAPRVLAVVAHPDDETAFAATLYKVATFLGGACDIAVITDGQGGFKYATLAEPIYGLELTREEVGRAHLPEIRLQEMLAGARLLFVRDLYWFGEPDHRYTQDAEEVLAADAGVWDLERVRGGLLEILRDGRYDFVFTLLPSAQTHGHHKAASVLALEAIARLPRDERPVALSATVLGPGESAPAERDGLALHPLTRLDSGPELVFDRRMPIGYQGKLDYTIVVDWVIAEHRSQGTMQIEAGHGERECFLLYADEPPQARERAEALFRELAQPQFPVREYGASAGAPPSAKP